MKLTDQPYSLLCPHLLQLWAHALFPTSSRPSPVINRTFCSSDTHHPTPCPPTAPARNRLRPQMELFSLIPADDQIAFLIFHPREKCDSVSIFAFVFLKTKGTYRINSVSLFYSFNFLIRTSLSILPKNLASK